MLYQTFYSFLKKGCQNMHNLNQLFDKETVKHISSLIEDKMPMLNQVSEFKEKDEKLANAMENFENSLPEDLSKKFNNMLKLNYQVDEYYFTLAYFLGRQHGEKIVNL